MQECFCFPIILLMFTENTIKHNMIMGEELRVRITGSLVERNGENMWFSLISTPAVVILKRIWNT